MRADNIRVVLVQPSHPGNIGATARALKTMGLGQLTLVAPRSFPNPEATWRAAAAADVLDRAVVAASLDEAIAGCQFVVGTSGRDRRIPWPVQDPRRCAARIAAHAETERVAIVFGREDRGLSNAELQRCNLLLHIPSADAYTSLNLAMAVQVVCYELRMLGVADALPEREDADWDAPWCSTEDMERLFRHLEETLVDIDFLNPAAPRQLMPRLRRLYSRVRLDQMEVNILRGILTQTQHWVRLARSAADG